MNPHQQSIKSQKNDFWKIASMILAMVISFSHMQSFAYGEDEPTRAYQVKAAFLFNFAQFVTWPKEAFANDKDPIVIGVYGNNPFGKSLETIINGKTANGRDIVVKQIPVGKEDQLSTCQMVFIPSDQDDHLEAVLKAVKGRSVLIVGESDKFASVNGTLRFYLEENKLRFEIRLKAVRDAKLEISAKLLKLARIIDKE